MLRELYAHDIMDKLRAAAGAGRENSREKGRMIPEKDFWKIHYKLMTMKDWGIRAQHLMLAGLGSGARPIEWVNAKWINEPNGILRLQTAKVKNINAWNNVPPMFFGEEDDENPPEFSRAYINQFRNKIDQLDLLSEQKEELNKNKFLENEVLFRDVYIEEEYRFVITMHMENIRFFFNTHDPNYTIWDMPSEIKAKYYRDVYYNHCRQSVYQACKKLFGTEKRYSPVDTRSTFSANRRAMKGNAAAAIEMGNASGGARIASHYSKKSLAWEKYRNWQQDGAKQDPRPQNEKWGQEQSQSFDPAISHQNY